MCRKRQRVAAKFLLNRGAGHAKEPADMVLEPDEVASQARFEFQFEVNASPAGTTIGFSHFAAAADIQIQRHFCLPSIR
jgi:hypothetical protein